jgi:putative SOS response-associated peptidase YedK
VILQPDKFRALAELQNRNELLKPAADNVLQRWPVSKRVNSSRADGDDATLIDKIELPA